MAESDEQKERRVSVELREIFVVAYEVVEPFLDPKNSWGGQTHEHLAYRTVHERFPQLSGEEVFVIISAAKRVYAAGGRPAPAK
ncbi:MAG: hypothetical protein OHM77_12335 [Candidatus Nitricoxidivorans perseverans]|uniref:Uncharacterized protein n=1 Tax=Candidatus Nitricoxidivorans perseverans TaxID=2975601 RepID=A0AA49FJU6_9PROT|nr:MAG: hypothetical protein OHM77_12335 [Candidatus Nitricoxidivorans perseverans]